MSISTSDVEDSFRRGVGEIAEQAIAAYRLTYQRKAQPSLKRTYSDRSGWLLFLVIYRNAARLIDVRRHGEENVFSLHELVETYIRTWPEAAEPICIAGALGLARASDHGCGTQA
jgi:hypothetical protein